jgi:hypothetical protein
LPTSPRSSRTQPTSSGPPTRQSSAAIVTRYLLDAPVDPIILGADLAKSGDVTRIGGAPYLHHLVQQVPSATSGEYYAEIVREKAVLRNLQMACTRTLHVRSPTATTETGELLDDLRAEVDGIVDDTSRGDEDTLIGADGEDFLEQLEHLQKHGPARGVKTGFTDFDSLTNGLQPGQLIVIAARPAIGKSTLGTDIVRHATIVEGLSAVFFSLEMSRTELKMKIASAQAQGRPAPPAEPERHDGRRLDPPRQGLAGDQRCAARHRRRRRPDADEDPIALPAHQAQARPAPRRHRLPPAHGGRTPAAARTGSRKSRRSAAA